MKALLTFFEFIVFQLLIHYLYFSYIGGEVFIIIVLFFLLIILLVIRLVVQKRFSTNIFLFYLFSCCFPFITWYLILVNLH